MIYGRTAPGPWIRSDEVRGKGRGGEGGRGESGARGGGVVMRIETQQQKKYETLSSIFRRTFFSV